MSVTQLTTRVDDSSGLIRDYLRQMEGELQDLDEADRAHLLSYTRAQIELDLELSQAPAESEDAIRSLLSRYGPAAQYARRLRVMALPETATHEDEEAGPRLVPCRVCARQISPEAYLCPQCGAPFPARKVAPGFGYEYKSKARLFGLPVVHVAFGRDKNGKLRVAKGIIAIGQFGMGGITIAQFGVGAVFGLGQFVVAPLAIGQFAGGLVAVGQFAFGILAGAGMIATGLLKALGAVRLGPH